MRFPVCLWEHQLNSLAPHEDHGGTPRQELLLQIEPIQRSEYGGDRPRGSRESSACEAHGRLCDLSRRASAQCLRRPQETDVGQGKAIDPALGEKGVILAHKTGVLTHNRANPVATASKQGLRQPIR